MAVPKTFNIVGVIAGTAIAAVTFTYLLVQFEDGTGHNAEAASSAYAQGRPAASAKGSDDALSIALSDPQLWAVKVEPATEREFPIEKGAVGSIGFNEEMTVQVFTPYSGRIIGLFAKLGDDVKKGQTLFTIDSPDLLQAESTLIAAAGVLLAIISDADLEAPNGHLAGNPVRHLAVMTNA